MDASTDAKPLEADLADVAAELAWHVERQCERLAAVHNRALASRSNALPLGASVVAIAGNPTPSTEPYDRR